MVFLPIAHMTCEHQYDGTNWDDITGSLVSVLLTLREFTGAHTASVVLYDDTIDPAQSSGTHVLKEGDKVRLYADNSSGTSRKMATFRIGKVVTDIDLAKPPGLTHRVTMTLKGVGITGVGGVGSASGTDDYTELSNVITGAAFEIDGDGFGSGTTTPSGTLTEAAVINEATELDQVILTRDSNPGVYVFEDPEGTIQVFDSATARTGAATWTIGPDNYSHINMRGVDTTHVINVLTLRYVEKIKTGSGHTRKVELEQVFEDSLSIAKYGRHKKKMTVHKKSDFDADFAALVFARNADPDPVPTSVTIPVRAASELLPGYADGAYVAGKVDVVAPDGVTTYTCRVARIVHTITQRRWLVDIDLRNASVIQRPRAAAAAVDTEVSNNPDGTVLTAHLDDLAVTGDKLADAIDGTGKTISGVALDNGASLASDSSGPRVEVNTADASAGVAVFSDAANETAPATVTGFDLLGDSQLIIASPINGSGHGFAFLTLWDDAGTPRGTLGGDLEVTGDATVDGSATITDGLTLHGLGGHTITGAVDSNSRITTTAELHGDTVWVDSVPTTTNGANTNMGASGKLQKSTSLSRHKIKQQPMTLDQVRGLLDLTPKTWIDRAEWLDNGRKYDGLRRIPGLIAEDVETHAPAFATYTEAGELEGVAYDRVAAGLLLLAAEQRDQLAYQAAQLEDLTNRLTRLESSR